MVERVLPDAAERRRAATDFEQNLVVLAGAGTGKTSLLVERVLNAIGGGVATMAEIGAITFTEKAAGEMRERLTIGLESLRSLALGETQPDEADEAGRAFLYLKDLPEYSGERTAARALRAMEQLDAGTVTTIHGFCAELLRSYPLQAGVDPGFVVDSGEQADLLLDTTWRSFVGTELGPDATRADEWTGLLARVSLPEVAEVALGSAGFHVPAELLNAPWPGLSAVEVLCAPAATLATEIEELLAVQTGLSPKPVEYFESAVPVLRAFEREGIDAFRERMRGLDDFRSRVESRKSPPVNKKLEEELKATAKRLLESARSLLGDLWEMDDEPSRALLEAASPFALEYREQYLRRGFVSFDGLLALARDLLRDHAAVREKIKQRYRLLLVDEFQDTDPLQYEIVLFLAEAPGDAAAKPFEASLAPGRLFVVGDAKQSIYRFRGADYSAYRRALDRIKECGGSELNLVANFRSVPDVTEPVNRLFEAPGSCWEESRYQPEYVPIEAARKRAGGAQKVELWTVRSPDGALSAENGRVAEGRLIAREIRRAVTEEPVRYQDFTILFRSFTSLSVYLRPLRELGIPFVVGGGREFLERPEVTQLMATYRTLARPADQPALLAFLRSAAGAVSDEELAGYASERTGWDLAADADAGKFPGIARCFELLRGLKTEIARLPADAAFRRILDRTLMLPLGAAAFEGPQRVANLQKLTAAACELARDGRLSFEEVLTALEAGNLEQVKTDQPLADDAAEAVRISTMHGMKGLENRRIIVPDLGREKRHGASERAVALTRLPDGRPALAIKVAGTRNSPRVWHDMEDRRHDLAEEVRVLYVALTRAREQLVLLARKGRSKPAWIQALAAWDYDVDAPPEDGETLAGGLVAHRLLEPPGRESHESAQPLAAYPQAVEDYRAAVGALREASGAQWVAPSAAGEPKDASRDARADTGGGRASGMVVGRVLHRALESWDGGERPSFDEIVVALSREEARDAGDDSDSIADAAKEVSAAFLDSDLAQRFRSIERLGREVPILLRGEEGILHRGSIDLLYKDEDGTVVVADYKTDHEIRESELRSRYGEQLRLYASAAQRALELPESPRTELWMLRSGRRVVLA